MTTPISLKQLAESKTGGVQKTTNFKLHPSVIKIEKGWNGRMPGPELDAHIELLYQAMKAGESVPPIEVQMIDGEPVVRDGHCRTQAALRLVDEGIEYMLEARQFRGNDVDAMFLMLNTGTGQRALTPLEQGTQYLKLLKMGVDVAGIAERRRIHRSTVENGIQLAEMPTAVQKLVASGKVAAHTALKTVKAHGAKEAVKLLEEAAQGEKKVKPKQLPAGPGKKERGQTLPPVGDLADLTPETLKAMREAVARTEVAEARLAELDAKLKRREAAQIDLLAKMSAPVSALPPLNPPQAQAVETPAGTAILKRLAAVNVLVSTIDRAVITQLVKDARALVGEQ